MKLRIGIVCYPTYGGSGAVATMLGLELAQRGHDVHFISYALPFRLRGYHEHVTFHEVKIGQYPLFEHPPYSLALAVMIHEVAVKQKLDVIHAHYAIPHANAAWQAKQLLDDPDDLALVTTLHGTDITLVGSDPSYARVVAFSIERSHGITAVSRSLRADTIAAFGTAREIHVIPNFLDCGVYRRRAVPAFAARLRGDGDDRIVVHASNFRPVKQVAAVVEVFRRIRARVPARLVLIGDGPDRPAVQRQVADAGLQGLVEFAGEQHDLVPWLSAADLFLLPSQQESFGLAALEAMACEVPVVASRVGGLPEVIDDGEEGFLFGAQDVEGMAACGIMLLRDGALRARIGHAAALRVRTEFCADRIVPLYESLYRRVTG